MDTISFRFRDPRAAWVLALSIMVAACGGDGNGAPPATDVTSNGDVPAEIAAATRIPIGPATDLPANELGEIMVLEYHRTGEPEGEFRRKLENFKADLERLYAGGYRPITVRQMIEGDIDVPRGTTPVAFTFDDSTEGQFYFLEDGSVDPNSMVGVWDAFRRDNPGWENGATWCVLPAADYPSNFFGEKPSREVPREERETRIQRKVDHLLENGHEICNHTLFHARLDRAKDDLQVQEWIGRGADSIRVYLPADYQIVTLALPLGQWPRNRSLAWQGTHAGRQYTNQAVLEVSGGPNESPFSKKFDPHSVNRVIVAPGHLERQLAAYDKSPARRFISDGDPRTVSVPESRSTELDPVRAEGRTVRTVPDWQPPQPAIESVAEPAPSPSRPASTPSGEGL